MAGLLSQRGQDAGKTNAPGNAAVDSDVDGEAPNATPEEQAQYDQFMNNALEIIYPAQTQGQPSEEILRNLSGQMAPQSAEMLAQADPPISNNPIDNLAATGVSLIIMLEGSALQAKVDVMDNVLFHVGKDVLEELAEVAQAAGIYDYSEQEMESSFYRALDIYRVSSPTVDQNQLSQQFGAIVEADRSGQLGQILPGSGATEGGA